MSVKRFVQGLVFVFFLLVFLAVPVGVQAGGVCGGTYVVDAGDTLGSIAAKCGTTVSAITTANPGVSDPLRSGQTLTLPGSGSSGSGVNTSIVSSSSSTTTTTTTNYYRPQINYGNGTYIVQYGDTFSGIASRYGVTVNQLWAANPQIWNINWLYAGQLIYLPGYTNYSGNASATSVPLSYGNVPAGTPNGTVWLDNRSGGDIYVSLQGTTRDGIKVINEYPVSASMRVKVPAGWYVYVAWVGGRKYEGQFQLGQGSDRTIKFYNNKTSAN
jgi:LysM repeat protein